jgi:hypothetical protein
VALIGSNGRLEIAVVLGDAQETLGTRTGDKVTCLPQGRGEGFGPNRETA